jgi:predicted Zn-dependent peptidase
MRRGRSYLSVLLAVLTLLFSVAPAVSAPGWQDGDDVRRTELPNGLVLLTKERRDPDSVAINIAVRAGSRDEDDRTSGAAHFMEHMFFQGTPRRPSAFDVDRPITTRGGSLNATTQWELISFNAVVRSADVGPAIDVLADILINSLFDAEALEKERRVVLQELNARLNSPSTRASDLFFQTVFAGHPARHLPAGSRETVLSIDRDTLLAFRDRWFAASNMVIAVVGNVSHDEVVDLVSAAFQDLPNWSLPPRPAVTASFPVEHTSRRISAGSHQAQVLVGVPAPSFVDSDRYAMDIIDAVIDDAGRRLFTEIRDRRGLAYSVGSAYITLTDAGVWLAAAGVDPENVDLVGELILAEMRRLAEQPLTPAELDEAKTYIEGRSVVGLETNLGQARRFSGQEVLGVREPIADYLARIRGVTAADVQRVALRYFGTDNYTLVVVEP